eukprot:9478823-Pyramimonas_sp.AAC.1
MSWLLYFITLRGAFVAVEQPIRSLLFQAPWMATALGDCNCKRYVTNLGNFGGPTLKCLEIYTNMPGDIAASQLVRTGRKRRLTKRLTRRDKMGRTTGNRKPLSASQAYPTQFAAKIAESCMQALGKQ